MPSIGSVVGVYCHTIILLYLREGVSRSFIPAESPIGSPCAYCTELEVVDPFAYYASCVRV
jgi:hypothetical protein